MNKQGTQLASMIQIHQENFYSETTLAVLHTLPLLLFGAKL